MYNYAEVCIIIHDLWYSHQVFMVMYSWTYHPREQSTKVWSKTRVLDT